jgi:hypothetical protein
VGQATVCKPQEDGSAAWPAGVIFI